MASTDLEVKYRNMFAQALLTVVTLGFYVFYWFYATSRDMEKILKREEPVFLWTILLFVPLLWFYSYYKYGELFEKISPDTNRWIMVLLWFFFPPAVWVIVQLKLNRLALSSDSLS